MYNNTSILNSIIVSNYSKRSIMICSMIEQEIKESIKRGTLDLVKIESDYISASFEKGRVTELKIHGEIFSFDTAYHWDFETIQKGIIISEGFKHAFHPRELIELDGTYTINLYGLDDRFYNKMLTFSKEELLLTGKVRADIQDIWNINLCGVPLWMFKKSGDVYGIGLTRIVNISETAREIARYGSKLAGDQYDIRTLDIVLDRAIGIDKEGRGVKLVQAFLSNTFEPLPLLFEVTIEKVEGYSEFEVYGIGKVRDAGEFDEIISNWEIRKEALTKISGDVLEEAERFLSKEFKEFVEKIFGYNILEYAAFTEDNDVRGTIVPVNAANPKTVEWKYHTRMGVNKKTKMEAMQMLHNNGYELVKYVL